MSPPERCFRPPAYHHHLPPLIPRPHPWAPAAVVVWSSTCLYARDPPSNALLQNQPEQPSDFAKSETYWWVKEGNWTEMGDWKAAKQDGVTAKVMTVCLWGVKGSSSKTEKGAELLRLKSAIHSKVVSSLQGKDKYKRQYCENGAKIFCQIQPTFLKSSDERMMVVVYVHFTEIIYIVVFFNTFCGSIKRIQANHNQVGLWVVFKNANVIKTFNRTAAGAIEKVSSGLHNVHLQLRKLQTEGKKGKQLREVEEGYRKPRNLKVVESLHQILATISKHCKGKKGWYLRS